MPAEVAIELRICRLRPLIRLLPLIKAVITGAIYKPSALIADICLVKYLLPCRHLLLLKVLMLIREKS
jgi:hypothetical protein